MVVIIALTAIAVCSVQFSDILGHGIVRFGVQLFSSLYFLL